MASILNSTEEHSEYLYDHLICIKIMNTNTRRSLCVALDSFTKQIYVFTCIHEFLPTRIGTVLIYSQCGGFLRSFSLEDMGDYAEFVHGIAIYRNNVYIISGLFCIHHFKVADSMSLICCKHDSGSDIGEFMDIRQLDISNEGDLFVVDFGNNRVQILDGNLQYKRHISHRSMFEPCDVKLTPDEVYVSAVSPEQSTYCIHIFTYLGEKLRSIILNGIPNSIPWRGFCVDTRGNAAIIDNANCQIKFFTKEGNLIGTMVTLKEVSILGKSKNIIGITWITNQKLIVLSKENGCRGLEIYSYI